MKTITVRVALAQKLAPQRARPYKHRPGAFTLTASFRDKSIDEHRVNMVVALIGTFTQDAISRMLGVGVGIVSKCVRIVEARKVSK